MPLTITDFIEQVDGISTEDIPLDERERINDALADLTGGPGGGGAPVNNDAILVSKNLDGREGFSSIQSAVDSDSVSAGNTIFVEPGTYEGPATIDVEDLTLKAADGASPTINISAESRTDIPADDVTINGFSVVFEGQAAYIRGDNVTVEDNTFELESETTSTGYALRYEGLTSDGEVRNNEFLGITNDQSEEFGNGVIIAGPDGHEVVGNTFDGNSIGVNVGSQQPAGELLVSDNTFTSQDDFGVALNHDDSGSPSITISSNDFDSNPTGILALSGGDIDISSNELTGDSSTIYVDDQAGVLALSAIEDSNTFNPSVVRVGDRLLPAVSSDGELKGALDADFEDAGDESEEGLGETIPLDSGYTSGLDGSAVRTQNVVSVEEGTYTQMFLDKSQINTDSSFTTDRGNEAISGAYIQENGQVQYLNVIIQGGNVFFFVPERLQGEEITFAVGNMNQDDGGDFAELSGDDIVTGKITVAS